ARGRVTTARPGGGCGRGTTPMPGGGCGRGTTRARARRGRVMAGRATARFPAVTGRRGMWIRAVVGAGPVNLGQIVAGRATAPFQVATGGGVMTPTPGVG